VATQSSKQRNKISVKCNKKTEEVHSTSDVRVSENEHIGTTYSTDNELLTEQCRPIHSWAMSLSITSIQQRCFSTSQMPMRIV